MVNRFCFKLRARSASGGAILLKFKVELYENIEISLQTRVYGENAMINISPSAALE